MRILLAATGAAVFAIQGLAGTDTVRNWQTEQTRRHVCAAAVLAGDEARMDRCAR